MIDAFPSQRTTLTPHSGLRAVIITWQLCPRCGALGPLLEHPGLPRTLQRKCCGVMPHLPPHAPALSGAAEDGTMYR
jgi:hypothetical protein